MFVLFQDICEKNHILFLKNMLQVDWRSFNAWYSAFLSCTFFAYKYHNVHFAAEVFYQLMYAATHCPIKNKTDKNKQQK